MRRLFCLLILVAGVALFVGPAALARKSLINKEAATVSVSKSIEVGTRDPKYPVWPLLDGRDIVGYVFETSDLVNIPGFTGTPINMAITMDDEGTFKDVRLISQSEPVFVNGLGVEPLDAFLKQYQGKSIHNNIKVSVPHQRMDREGANTYIDGVTKASVSVRIINETILNAALKVAREKMADQIPTEAAQVRRDVVRSMTWQQLLDRGYVQHLHLTNGQMEAAFAGTRFAGIDPDALSTPAQAFIDLYFAQVNVPTIGASILSPKAWQQLGLTLEDTDEALLVMSTGPKSFKGEVFIPGAVPDTLAVRQGDFPINLRNQVFDVELQPGAPAFSEIELYRIDRRSGFDPGVPWKLSLRVPRSRGFYLEEAISRDFTTDYSLPADFFFTPEKDASEPWLAVWKSQVWVLAVLVLSLAALTWALVRHKTYTTHKGLLTWSRPLFLAFALVFIGWYAQAQLSIVTVLALVKMIRVPGGFSFLLYDPASLILWIYVLATLVIWGRGAFCGWLCPFGALQELVARAAALLGVHPWQLDDATDRKLSWLKYAVLGVLVCGTLAMPAWAERLAEVEPFKTSITLGFIREWPYVVYALALVAGGAILYKGFCRFLCPLGAALALPSFLRNPSWLPRRAECGSPCQLCRKKCEYGAIAPDGRIRYAECRQCLDCEAIYHDGHRCPPLVLASRRRGAGKSAAALKSVVSLEGSK